MRFRLYFSTILAFICIASIPGVAKTTYELSEFSKSNSNAFIGPVTIGDTTLVKAAISPDFTLGSFELGLDLNLYIGDHVPDNLNSVVFRHLKFDYDDAAGIEVGRLEHVTLGQGLLMDNYDSGSFGSYEFTNKKAGVRGYIDYSPIRVEALYTASEVLGTRLVYTIENSFLLGAPLSIGGTYVKDRNGIDDSYDGVSISRSKQEGWSADISVPVAGKYFTGYGEYAELTDVISGKGGSIGFRGEVFKRFRYRAEYRSLGTGFIPGYFDQNYEATSQTNDLALDKRVEGFLTSVGLDFGTHFKINATLEDYGDADPILSGSMGWGGIGGTSGVVNYTQAFGGDDSSILSSDVLFNRSGMLSYIVHFKRVYYPNGEQTDSYGVGLQTNLDHFFKLPFSGK